MNLTIGDRTFDWVDYDADADVLYLSIGKPRPAVGEETPEGHVLLYAQDDGELCGLTIVGPKHILESKRKLLITMPRPEELTPDKLTGVFKEASSTS